MQRPRHHRPAEDANSASRFESCVGVVYHFCKNHLWYGPILISQQISDSLLIAAPLEYSWPLSLYGHSLMYSVSLGSAVHSWFDLKPSRSPGSVDNYYRNE